MARSSIEVKNTPRSRATIKTATSKNSERIKTIKIASPKLAKDTTVTKPVRKRTVTKTYKAPKSKSSTKKADSPIPQEVILKIKPTGAVKRNPLGHLLMEKLFREAGFRGTVSTDPVLLNEYSTDESIFSIRPQVVIQPKNRHDVEIATGIVSKETGRFSSLSLTPRGAGTGLSGGSLTDSIVIDVCTHLRKIGDVVEKKEKITITCEPGAMWRDVERKLKSYHAYLPPYPASKDICSIGGSVANNSAGPDSLRYGHCADWIESLDIVLRDGHTYTIKPINYHEFKHLIKQDHEHARIANAVFELITENEKEIKSNRPKNRKNSAGYALWQVLPEGVEKFKKGEGMFDLTKLVAGSQGTIGIIVEITLRALALPKKSHLIVVPIFKLEEVATVIQNTFDFNPTNVEVYDALTFDLALQHPSFFRERLSNTNYYRVMFTMYHMYHVRYNREIPEFTVLITINDPEPESPQPSDLVKKINGLNLKTKVRLVRSKLEQEMYWQIRRASYSLSKLLDPNKRPAAFLEDMTVPPKNLSKFFMQIKRLLKEYNVKTTIHGHGGNGHFHFYPLLDFTSKTTPALVEKMSEEFYNLAIKFDGGLCGEHNDGIIRTPHLSKMFSKKMIELFKKTEQIFDPDDIFNPGKKVNPRFDIKTSIRTTN